MNVDQASKIIVKPYITEKTFAMVENESKICFIVERSASKPEIAEAVNALYNEKVQRKHSKNNLWQKAFVQFENTEKARDLGNKDRNAIIWTVKLEVH